MFKLLTRKRLAMPFGMLGIALMGVDLMMTRNFFSHIGELMAAGLSCFFSGPGFRPRPEVLVRRNEWLTVFFTPGTARKPFAMPGIQN